MAVPFNIACSLCAGVLAMAVGLWTMAGRRRRDAINLCFGWMCLAVAGGASLACAFWALGSELAYAALAIAALEYAACTLFAVALAGYAWFTVSRARGRSPSRHVTVCCLLYALCDGFLLWAYALVAFRRPDLAVLGVLATGLTLLTYVLAAVPTHRSMAGVPTGERLLVMLLLTFPTAALALQACIWLVAPGYSVLFLILTGGLLVVLMGVQSHRELAYSRRRAELIRMRNRTALSQMQPHFLCNTLAAVRALCWSDPALAGAVIADFSDYLTVNMASLAKTTPVPFEDELRHVWKYLNIEALRMGERLRVTYDLLALDFSLPALTVQTLVENAVRHGVSKRPEGGSVRIATHEESDRYVVVVEDDGVGFDVEAPLDSSCEHVGIAGARLRLLRMCAGALEIKSAVGVGTRVTVLLPKMREGQWEHAYGWEMCHEDHSCR